MSDDPRKTGRDRKLIALDDPYQVLAWTILLRCTEAQLREAVRAVGHSAEAVRLYLKKN